MTLEELRRNINRVDLEILKLIKERATYVHQVGEVKNCTNSYIYVPEREKQILEALKKENENTEPFLSNNSIVTIFTEIISTCRNLEKPISISYLGPDASYSHLTAIKKFGSSAVFNPEKSIEEVFYKVEKDFSDYGVVPIENSTGGAIDYTLDRLAESSLRIVSEVENRISHSLLSTEQDIHKIKKVYAHSQSFAQCKNWVLGNLKSVELIEVSSNSLAAKIASEEKHAAAIASKLAASTYGLSVLHEGIEDSIDNTTRFLVIGKNENKPSGHDKTSIMFSPLKEEIGALYKSLQIFYENNINLTMIESRPDKKTPWRYRFFIDAEGHISNEPLAGVCEKLKTISADFKIIGSYPKS